MDPVKSPKKWDLMVKEMPDIEHEIHKGNSENDLDPQRSLNAIEDSQVVGLDIIYRPKDSRSKDQMK